MDIMNMRNIQKVLGGLLAVSCLVIGLGIQASRARAKETVPARRVRK